MYINKVDQSNISYGAAKNRFLSENMRASISSILIRMNSEVERVYKGDYYEATMLTKLHYRDKATFEDERRLTKKLKHNEQSSGFSVLTIGKNVVLDIDNKTGEIVDFIKPFYKPWFFIMKRVEKMLAEIRTNFYDNELVQKDKLMVRELTPEGNNKIKKLVLGVEKQRYENLVKDLEKSTEEV